MKVEESIIIQIQLRRPSPFIGTDHMSKALLGFSKGHQICLCGVEEKLQGDSNAP